MKKIFTLLTFMAFLSSSLFAKEPTNILVGFGIGFGQSKLSIEHSQIARYPTITMTAGGFTPQRNSSTSSNALAWEFMVGYKHFLNDFVGFRYYGNIGIQHYNPKSLGEKKQNIGYVDYTLNADLLIDFWESEFFAVGMLGGIGVGGTSFDKDAISKYLAVYDTRTGIPMGLADIQKHFLNVNASVGLRFAIFQKVRRTGARVCDEYVQGKRVCRVPIFYIGHNIEINAKFPLMDYQATPSADIIRQNNATVSRPRYVISNPYRITLRYVVDF